MDQGNSDSPAATPLELRSLSAQELAAIGRDAPASGGLAEVCAHVTSSKGKQVRARLLLAAARNGRHPDRAGVRSAAAAVEAIHLASLTHDDVIDDGRERRGVPTAVALFGNRRATTAGTWIVGRSVQLIARSGSTAIDSFTEAACALTDGEMREVDRLYDIDCTPERYLETVRRKTGALFWLAVRLGGLLSDAEPEVVRALERYGWEFGITYQMADDLLDLLTMNDVPDRTGRDLCNGLYTMPVIYALACSDELRELLRDRTDFDDRMVARVIEIVRDTGALERTLDEFHSHARAAKAAIADLPAPRDLELVVDYVVDRCPRAA